MCIIQNKVNKKVKNMDAIKYSRGKINERETAEKVVKMKTDI